VVDVREEVWVVVAMGAVARPDTGCMEVTVAAAAAAVDMVGSLAMVLQAVDAVAVVLVDMEATMVEVSREEEPREALVSSEVSLAMGQMAARHLGSSRCSTSCRVAQFAGRAPTHRAAHRAGERTGRHQRAFGKAAAAADTAHR
jgi:hypothetical protein